MEWVDRAVILSIRRFGEHDLIASLFAENHGRQTGLVKGGASRKQIPNLQPGNLVQAQWRARLAEQLGRMAIELDQAHAANLLHDPERLAAMQSMAALLELSLPEAESHPTIFSATEGLLTILSHSVSADDRWWLSYIRWELALLADLGFGLDLRCCAATGTTQDLVYVSPKSARAVSRQAGLPYHDKLLPLPSFLIENPADRAVVLTELFDGLKLSGHFLDHHLLHHMGKNLPPARQRLVDILNAK